MSQPSIARYSRTRYIILATLSYATFALLWIFVSDQLISAFIDVSKVIWLSMAKGMFFVGITSLLLYLALRFVPDTDNTQQLFAATILDQRAHSRWPGWLSYAFAIGITLAMLGIRLSLPVPVTARTLLILFMIPITLSAALSGLGPGLVATATSVLSLVYFVIPPVHAFQVEASHDLFQLGLLVVNGLLVSILSQTLHDSLRRIDTTRQLQAITLASAGDAIITTDTQGRVNMLNPVAEQLTGWTQQQATGQPLGEILTIFDSLDSPAGQNLLHDALTNHVSVKLDADTLLRNRKGDEYHVNITGAPILLSDGQTLGAILTIHDNTRHWHMRNALQEQSRLFHEMSTLARIGAWEYDPETGTGTWTEEVARIHEVAPRIEVNNEFVFGSGFWAPEQQAELEAAMRSAIEDGTSYDLELPLRTAKGNRRWVRISAAPVIQEGRTLKLRGSIQDISKRKEAELALRENEARYARVIEGSDQGFWELDLRDQHFNVSPRYLSMLGYPEKHQGLTLTQWRKHVHSEDLPKAVASFERHLAGLAPIHELEFRAYTVQSQLIWLHTRGKIVEWDEHNQPALMAGTHTDITARKLSEVALRQAATVFETTQEGVLITDADIRIVKVNRAFTQLTGYSEAEVIGLKPSLLNSGRNSQEIYAAMWHDINHMGYWQGELWNRRKNGEIFPVLISINAVKDESGVITHYVSVFMDISKLKASEERLDFLAHHDPLTRLPNRLLMFSQLEHALSRIQREHGALALLMLDLDRFKDVNDSFGHLAGDQLLQQVSSRLSERLRGSDSFARLGGDEFTILLEDLSRPEDAARVAEDIINALSEPFYLGSGVEIRSGASIGVSFSSGATTAESLLQQADAAMYRAKEEGRGCFQFFNESMTHAARERIHLDARLRRALDQNELCVHYQPQIDIATGRIVGAEALVRWISPEEGLIPPGRFIPIAEETGLINRIGEWVLRETCRQGRQWLNAGLPPLILAVNVSARQIRHGALPGTVEAILSETGFPADMLELELTESILMEERNEVATLLEELRSRRIRLAIDDFGTGYSSLAYLKRFPLDVLKIDKSFVDDISSDQDDRKIIKAIIEMGHTLGIKVLAEGVESAEQLMFLHRNGCDLYQGYFHSKPLPASEFEPLMLFTQ